MSESTTNDAGADGDDQHPIETHPLVEIFGDSAQVRVLAALLNHHPKPLNGASVAEAADIDASTFHRHKEAILAGLVEQQGKAGNSPLYGLPDDERTEALADLRAFQGAARRDEAELALDDE